MCGRVIRKTPAHLVAEHYGIEGGLPDLPPRYNIAPGAHLLGVRVRPDGVREIIPLRWGLVPPWSKEATIGYKMINARAETVQEKPAFRSAFRARRCLIPVDGFYEWRRTGKTREPFYIHFRDGRVFSLAGLWEQWDPGSGEILESCAIVTGEPNDVLRSIHNRMPVIIGAADYNLWLDPLQKDLARVAFLLTPCSSEEMIAVRVGTYVNNPKNNGEECLRANAEDQ